MKLEMFPVQVEVTEQEHVIVTQPGSVGCIKLSVEQVPFLIELLHQARTRIEDERYRRQSDESRS